MSLQSLSNSFAASQSSSHKAFNNFYDITKKVDPITEQILQTKDYALEAMKLIENGVLEKRLAEEKRMPSTTFIGDLMDWFMGWGNYYNTANDVKAFSRTLLQNDASVSEYNCSTAVTVDVNVSTSFDVQKYPNNSCQFLEPINYGARVVKYFNDDNQHNFDSNEIVCRIDACIRMQLESCQPFCLSCISANENERNKNSKQTMEITSIWPGEYNKNGPYFRVEAYTYSDTSNLWKLDRVFDRVETVAYECVNKFVKPDTGFYLSIILPTTFGFILAGIPICCIVCRRQEESQELKALINTPQRHSWP